MIKKKYFGHFEYLKGLLVIDRTISCTNITFCKKHIFKQEEVKHKIITHIFGHRVHTIKIRRFAVIPTKEIFYQHFNIDGAFHRLDLIVCLLAIENEKGLNDFGWNLYTKMFTILYGAKRAEIEKNNFKELIKRGMDELTLPYEQLLINREIKIIGNIHHLALALFHKQKNVVVEIVKEKKKQRSNIDKLFFIFNDFSLDEIKKIEDSFEKVKKWIGPYLLKAFLWPPAIKFFDEITNRLSEFYKVVDYRDVLFDELSFATFVKALYRCDDIADWKIDKKNEFMQPFFPKKVRFLTLESNRPFFRFKNDKLRYTVLDHIVRLKAAFRNGYKDKIENYQVDIIIHSADNTNESEFMGDMINSDFNLNQMLQEISQKGVMTVGIQSNSEVSEDLRTFPFCKDIAIICKKELFAETTSKIKNFLEKNLQNLFSFTFESTEENKCIFHIRYRNNIVFKFCVQISISNIDEQSLEKGFSKAIKWNNISVPTKNDDDIYKKALFS